MSVLKLLPRRMLPKTLLGRIFSLIAVALAVFTLLGTAFLIRYQFTREIEDVTETLELLADTVQPTLSESAVIGDYDTIQRTVTRVSLSSYVEHVRFTDNNGVAIEAANAKAVTNFLPEPLVRRVERGLSPVSRVVLAGGRAYGYIDIQPAVRAVALHIWDPVIGFLFFALFLLVLGVLLLHMPLRRIVADLGRVSSFATGLTQHRGDQIQLRDAPAEIDTLTAALNALSQELTLQHRALLDSESRKSAILEAGLDSFITICDAGRIVDFSRSAEQMFGYAAHEVQGRLLSEVIVPPDLRQRHERGMAHWRLTGEGPVLRQRIEVQAMRRSGEVFPVELTIVPFSTGDRTHFAGFLRDITRRKQMEQLRVELEAEQRFAMDELMQRQFAIDQHAAVSITDSKGIIIYANQRLQDLSGYSVTELVGSSHQLLKSGLQDDGFYRDLWLTITGGQVWHREYANRAKNGQIYWVAGTIVPMGAENGRPSRFISIQTDITPQKRAEQQLKSTQTELLDLLGQYRNAERELGQRRARELAVGAQIQRTLLFGTVPNQQGRLDIATYTQPSQEIDGDFYEFFAFDDNTIDVVIGDVMGKGVPAALMGAGVKQELNRSLAFLLTQNATPRFKPSPQSIVNQLHNRVGGDLMSLDAFVTLAYLRIDTWASEAVLVDAGHLPVIHASRAGCSLLHGDNLALGVLENEAYREHAFPVEGGDMLFIYSDGITEARNDKGEEFGIDRLCSLIEEMNTAGLPPTMVVQNIRWHVNTFEDHAQASDDRTCIALRIADPLPNGTLIEELELVEEFELPRALDQLTPLRRRIEAAGSLADLNDDAVQSLLLAAFEAATNIVRHTPPRLADATIHCRLSVGHQKLEVDMHYLGSAFTPHGNEPDFSGESEGGFGLYIIRNSVDEVEYTSPVEGVCRIHLVKNGKGSPL